MTDEDSMTGGGEDDKGCPECGKPYNRFYEELDAYHCPNERCGYVASEEEAEQHTQGGEDDDTDTELVCDWCWEVIDSEPIHDAGRVFCSYGCRSKSLDERPEVLE